MKNDLTSDLIRDQVLKSARGRRRKRLMGVMASALLPIGMAMALLWPEAEVPVTAGSSPEVEEKPAYVTITTEQELLETLAHRGPVIATREDGTQWLYLTRE